jgi:transcriptional regulator with XRE-family HTH domain
MMTRQAIGQRVLLRRRDLGLTQKELAKRCGFPYQVISGLERGRQSIYAERLGVLAKALHVSSDYLLGLSKDEAAAPPRKRPRSRKAATVG